MGTWGGRWGCRGLGCRITGTGGWGTGDLVLVPDGCGRALGQQSGISGSGFGTPPSLLLSRCASFQRGMMVAPVLANLGPLEDVTLTPNPQEVEEVFTVPLAHLLQAENQGYTHFRSKGRYSYTLPVFLNGPYKVWGLTAIVTELTLELLAPDLYRRKTRVTGDR
uniref:Nudix hydrolase 8 n=1 Tax=Apteryx owenii TaxID=8824 RepID=A0A8B9PTY7_APTOW